MTYFQDLGDAARVSATVVAKIVALSLTAAAGGIIPIVGTSASKAAYDDLVTTIQALPSEDRSGVVAAAKAAGGNAAVLDKALAEATGMSTGTKLAIAGGVAVGAYLLFGRRR